VVEAYEKAVMEGRFPLLRGHVLDHDDLRIRQQILDLMCRHETELDTMLYDQLNEIETAVQLEEFVKDGLAEIKEKRIKITPKGRAFVRNICLAFDARYWKNQPVKDLFSTTA
jgi:oxygen-independent coproporphyrinogen-3 oxidase